ncbi:MAG: hypothetical protein F4207_02795 [Gemmatimonadetes bacterium]|nr:hypothetical protein [Gemmatimonadota bacterium]MYG15344.1 hypothetical protein [Gemmatimonadota bacterium]
MKNVDHVSPEDPKLDSELPEQKSVTTSVVLNSSSRTKSQPVESVGQLILQVYDGTFKRKKLRKIELDFLRKQSQLSDESINELVNQTSDDRILTSTFNLLQIGLRVESSKVSDEIARFVLVTLKKHPVFKGPWLNGPVENVIQVISNHRRYESLRWTDEGSKLTNKEMKECRKNALRCYLIWAWMTKSVPIERVIDYLLKHTWKPSVRSSQTDAEKVVFLVNARDSEAIVTSTDILHRDAADQKTRADSAESENEQLLKQVSTLESNRDEIQSTLYDTQVKADSLKKLLEKERQDHANDSAHLKDDYETLRGQVLRRLNEELALLEAGLHALRRNPPKVNVMVDHAERVIDGLRDECNRLLKRGDG